MLFLNSLGTGEVVLILMVVLILFGSKGLPDIAKNLGKGMREIKTASNEIKRDIQNSAMEMRKDLNTHNPMDELPKLNNILEEHPNPEKNDADSVESKSEENDQPTKEEPEA